MQRNNLLTKLQILSKLEYKSDRTESATGMISKVWISFMNLDLKEFKRVKKQQQIRSIKQYVNYSL